MSNFPTSESTPLALTTSVFPDWSRGVRSGWTFENAMSTAQSGLEQRFNRRTAPRKTMELTVAGLSRARNEGIIEILENRTAGPLLVPWFPEGLRVSTTMGSGTSVQLEVAPLSDWMPDDTDRVLIGDELRVVTGISDRTLTLEAMGGATLWSAGTWVFPMRLAAIDRPEEAVNLIRFDAAEQNLRFVQFA